MFIKIDSMRHWTPKNKEEERANELFLKSKKVNKYLDLHKDKKSTHTNYKLFLRNYFIELMIDPDDYLKDPRKMSRNKELDYKDKIENDIEKHFIGLKSQEKPPAPKTFGIIKTCIKGLLEESRIDLDNIFWNKINRILPKRNAITEKETPTREQLKSILNNMDIKGKALFMVQMTSFSRIEEPLDLTFNDIQLEYELPRIKTSYQYNKNGKMSLKRITPETKKILNDYIKIRNNWLISKLKRQGIKDEKERNKLIKNEKRIFPMTKQNATEIWTNAIKKAGLYRKDNDSNKGTMTPHSLRRYAKNNFISSYKGNGNNNGEFWANVFMNKGKETDKVYDTYTNEDLDKQYNYGIEGLIVFEETVDYNKSVIELRNKLKQFEGREKIYKDRLISLDETEERLNIIEKALENKIEENITGNPFLQKSEEQIKIEDKIEDKLLIEHNNNVMKHYKELKEIGEKVELKNNEGRLFIITITKELENFHKIINKAKDKKISSAEREKAKKEIFKMLSGSIKSFTKEEQYIIDEVLGLLEGQKEADKYLTRIKRDLM